jgi:outer membrane protein assembly factor BamB
MTGIATFVLFLASALVASDDWSQFRGPNAAGVSDAANLPTSFGPDENVVWKAPVPPGNSSPVVAGDKLYLTGFDRDRLLTMALDRHTGRVLWRTERPMAQRGYATPVLCRGSDGDQVLVAGSYRLSAYDIRSGRELWWIRRLPWQVKPTPVVAGEHVYFVTYSGESDPGQQETVPPFQVALARLDADKDGELSKDEVPDPAAKARFDEYLDLDDTGYLEERDWTQ